MRQLYHEPIFIKWTAEAELVLWNLSPEFRKPGKLCKLYSVLKISKCLFKCFQLLEVQELSNVSRSRIWSFYKFWSQPSVIWPTCVLVKKITGCFLLTGTNEWAIWRNGLQWRSVDKPSDLFPEDRVMTETVRVYLDPKIDFPVSTSESKLPPFPLYYTNVNSNIRESLIIFRSYTTRPPSE